MVEHQHVGHESGDKETKAAQESWGGGRGPGKHRPLKGCPGTPREYCDAYLRWAQDVEDWLGEANDSLIECGCSASALGKSAVKAGACGDWQDAWTELRDFAKALGPYMLQTEQAVLLCTGGKIGGKFPAPKGPILNGEDEDKRRKDACRRGRKLFRRFKSWGRRVQDEINEHCEDDHPHHLGPPPDPPF